jgi:magnesium transporter
MMITVYKTTDQGLEQIDEMMPGTWVHLVDPQREEIEEVVAATGIPEAFLTSALHGTARARTAREDSATLIIMRVPRHFGKDDRVPYKTVPFGMVLCPGYLITVCKFDTSIADDLLTYQVKGLSTEKHVRLILQIMLVTFEKYFLYLHHIESAIAAVEGSLQESLQNAEVLKLVKYQNCLVYFTTGLRSNQLVMQRLQDSPLSAQLEEEPELLQDVLFENVQALELTEIPENILSQDMDAFASIISNNLNLVMKFLASVTIILTVPALIAAIYGMNVTLPFERNPFTFSLIMSVAIISALLVTWIFWRRDWL